MDVRDSQRALAVTRRSTDRRRTVDRNRSGKDLHSETAIRRFRPRFQPETECTVELSRRQNSYVPAGESLVQHLAKGGA